jgi:hypothetical protein
MGGVFRKTAVHALGAKIRNTDFLENIHQAYFEKVRAVSLPPISLFLLRAK